MPHDSPPRRLDLPRGDARARERLQAMRAEVEATTALGSTSHSSFMHLTMLGFFRYQHGSINMALLLLYCYERVVAALLFFALLVGS